MPHMGPSPFRTMDNIRVSQAGVYKLLRGLRPFKATGPDEIPAYILKEAADHISPYLTIIYQKSLDTGAIPDDWRAANIVPVFKKGEKHKASNYRPVSLTSICCKLLEHIVHSTIMDHFDRHQILCDHQHGFRSKRSCETQLLITLDEIGKNLDQGEQTDIILLDFSKAFDKVPHKRLLQKMDHYGIRGETLKWIQDFLSKRTQSVLLEGHKSGPLDVISGVPQGTVIGPLLFLAYINDLPQSTSSEARLFADDCLVYRKIKNVKDAETLQDDLNKLQEWESRWQMNFHPEKCIVIRITNKRNPLIRNYQLHGHTLEAVEHGKYLGVTVKHDLQWKTHINQTVGKASRTLGFLRRNLGRCKPEVKANAYITMVRPTLEYASTVWDPYQDNLEKDLEQVQRRAARFVYNEYQDVSPGCVSSLMNRLKWEPLKDRRCKDRLTMAYKIRNRLVDIDPSNYYKPGDSRTRGGHRIYQQRTRKDQYRFSFFPRSTREWNTLPEKATTAATLEEFKASLTILPEALTGASHI